MKSRPSFSERRSSRLRISGSAGGAPPAAESGGALVLLEKEESIGGGVGLGFRDSDDDLRGKFDAAIKSMKCDGTLDAMIVKEEYFGAAAVVWGDAGKEGC